MKKLESTWYNMLAVLTLISVMAGAALAYVNDITLEPIARIKAQALSDGIRSVLNAETVTVQKTDSLENEIIIYSTDKGSAVQATDKNAFSGRLTVLVGFDEKGVITGYQVLESSETPGLGAKANEWFRQGKGSIIGRTPTEQLTVSKDGGDVDAITASTITSRAFLRCVNAAYAALYGAWTDAESGATVQTEKKVKTIR